GVSVDDPLLEEGALQGAEADGYCDPCNRYLACRWSLEKHGLEPDRILAILRFVLHWARPCRELSPDGSSILLRQILADQEILNGSNAASLLLLQRRNRLSLH